MSHNNDLKKYYNDLFDYTYEIESNLNVMYFGSERYKVTNVKHSRGEKFIANNDFIRFDLLVQKLLKIGNKEFNELAKENGGHLEKTFGVMFYSEEEASYFKGLLISKQIIDALQED